MEKKLRLNIKGVLRFVILLGIVLWLWNFFRSYTLFLALILMMGSVLVSALLLWRGRNMIRAEAVLPPDRVGRGTPFSFSLKVSNPGRFAGFSADVTYSRSNVFTGYSERETAHFWAAPINGSGHDGLLSSQYAGRVEVCIEEFRVHDLFHIFYLLDSEKTSTGVVVWPGFSDAEASEKPSDCVEGFPDENESRRRGTDYNPEYEIREYIPGDALKSIHWKLSAKQGKMMVRERLATGHEIIHVLLPLGEDRKLNDDLVEAMYGVCRLLLDGDYPVQLYWPGRGDSLQSRFMIEQGELENTLVEILSDRGFHPVGRAQEQMAVEHPGAAYILIQTGAYKGAYIR